MEKTFLTHTDKPAADKKKSLLSLFDYSPDEVRQLLSSAGTLKKQRLVSDPKSFDAKTGVLIFEKPSLRTRITFETALYELGGHAIYLSADTVQMGKRESVKDVAQNLERWVHLIIARTFSHQTVLELAKYSSVPVINALSDTFHPCQALALGLTMRERIGDRSNAHVVFVGDGNNVCQSIMVLCAKLGYRFTAVGPEGYEPSAEITEHCRLIAKATGSVITLSTNLVSSVRDATVIYTDVWASMGQETEALERKKLFAPYQVNRKLLDAAPHDILISHCLPAHRGEEITSDVLDSHHSIALDEAENRLHVQKAVIVHLFS